MPSVSASHLVLFIAAVLVAGVLAGTLTQGAAQLGNAIEDQSEAERDHADAAISVVSDAGSPTAVYDDGTLTLYVKNVGDGTLPRSPDDVAVLVDGTYQADVETVVLGADAWRPGSLLRVRANTSLTPDTHIRVSVAVTGAQDYFTFTTP